MDLWLKIGVGILLVMMLVRLWPAYKHWQEHGPKAQKGDWQAVIMPLGLVIGFIILLIVLVR